MRLNPCALGSTRQQSSCWNIDPCRRLILRMTLVLAWATARTVRAWSCLSTRKTIRNLWITATPPGVTCNTWVERHRLCRHFPFFNAMDRRRPSSRATMFRRKVVAMRSVSDDNNDGTAGSRVTFSSSTTASATSSLPDPLNLLGDTNTGATADPAFHDAIAPSSRTLTDDRTWQQYVEIITDVMHQKRVIGKQLATDQIQLVQEYLLRNERRRDISSPPTVVVSSSSTDDSTATTPTLSSSSSSTSTPNTSATGVVYRTTMRDRMSDHRQTFVRQSNWTVAAHDYCGRCLVYFGNVCAKRQLGAACVPAWYKIRECGFVPRENAVSTFLYVVSMVVAAVPKGTEGKGGVEGQSALEDDMERQAQLETCLEIASFHDLLYEPNERTIVIRIKSLVARGDAAAAERILFSLPDKKNVDVSADDMSSSSWKRLRTFAPILQYYCDSGDVPSALRLYHEIRRSDGAHLDLETYVTVIAAAARKGWFRPAQDQSTAVRWAIKFSNLPELGLSTTGGPALFDQLITEMSEDLLELDIRSANIIKEALDEGFRENGAVSASLFVQRVSVNATTAICQASGAKLRLFQLTDEQRQQVHDTLLQMASSQHEEYGEKLRARRNGKSNGASGKSEPLNGAEHHKMRDLNGAFAHAELSKFSDFLCHRSGDSYTAFVDGPNVAYYGHGDVHWSQVQLVVDKLEQMGERPLVIVPRKYIGPRFWLSSLGFTQTLKKNELDIIQKLLTDKKLYVVPTACLDDYYWMLSSVAEQNPKSRLQVSTGNAKGRFPGLRPMLVTNDQMRDHKFELLEPRLFRRWTGCHIVNYDIKQYKQDEWENRDVKFLPADFFSREIQSNLAPDFAFNKAWHIPVSGWQVNERLCISIKR